MIFNQARRIRCLFLFLLLLLCLFSFSFQAQAMDRRVKGVIKSSAYGAAIGGLLGGAVWAAGLGGYRNVLLGASSGLYGGILLAGYIVSTPTDNNIHRQNPYAPKRRVNPEEEKIQYLEGVFYKPLEVKNVLAEVRLKDRILERTMWAPIALVQF